MKRVIGILKSELKRLNDRAEYFKKQMEYIDKSIEFFDGKDFHDYIERTYNEFDKRHMHIANSEKIYAMKCDQERYKNNLNSCHKVIEEVKTAIKILEGKSD